MPKIVVIAKGKARTVEMGQELTIGRGYSNLLRLDGEEISRVHAIIYRRNQDFIVRDLDSKNGVFVNGNRTTYAELEAGDRLQVGKYRMIFDPPSDFDPDHFADKALSNTASDSGQTVPDTGTNSSDDDYVRSQLFRAATPAKNAALLENKAAPDTCREEVLIYTREDLDRQLNDRTSTACDKAADYQEEFFHALVKVDAEETVSGGLLGMALCALIKALAAHRGVIVVRDAETNKLSPGAICAGREDVAVNNVVLKSGFTEGKAILCPATGDCGLFRDSATVTREQVTSLISIPLGIRDPLGLLYVDRQGNVDGFNQAHMIAAARVARLLEAHIADIIARCGKFSGSGEDAIL